MTSWRDRSSVVNPSKFCEIAADRVGTAGIGCHPDSLSVRVPFLGNDQWADP
jgi:hypothetical protein